MGGESMLGRMARALSCPPQLNVSFEVAVARTRVVEDGAGVVQEPLGDDIDGDGVDMADSHPGVGLLAQSSAAWPSLASSSAPAAPVVVGDDTIVEEGAQGMPGSSRPRPAPSSRACAAARSGSAIDRPASACKGRSGSCRRRR